MTTVPNLAQLQRNLQNSIIAGAAEFPGASTEGGVDLAARVGIYATAYRLRLAEALAANFPRLQQFCGSGAFASLADDYLEQHPSENASVRWFGHRLAAFLRDNAAFVSMPWLAELAQWEWDIAAAFDAPDASPIEPQALNAAAADWPQLRFELHPSVRLLRLRTNAVDLFRSLDEARGEVLHPRILAEPQSYLIWRQGLDVRFREQSDDEAVALALLGQNETFEALCAALCDYHEESEVPVRAASLLKTWVVEGLIARVIVP